VALEPRVNAENIDGTIGGLYVTPLNIAWFVPSSIVSKVTSNSRVFVTRGCAIAGMATRAMSSTSWYSETVPRSFSDAEVL